MRILLIILLCFARPVSATDICNGRYADAAALIEAAYGRYGTLYSGGAHYESLGPTLELYRLLVGLPPAGMDADRARDLEFADPGGHIGDPDFADETLRRSLARIHSPEFRRDGPVYTTDSEILLNNLTVIGPYPGWWLTPDAPHLDPVERVIAIHATDDALDWLLTIQAASARPHTISWRLQNSFRDGRAHAMQGVLKNALQRFQKSGGLHWLIAAMMLREDRRWEWWLKPQDDETLAGLDQQMKLFGDAVARCTASPATYVTFAIGTYEQIRFGVAQYNADPLDLSRMENLPAMLRRMAAVQLGKEAVADSYYSPRLPEVPMLKTLADDPDFDRWMNVGLSFRASTLDDLIEINRDVPLDPKTIRLLNILRADDLLRFAQTREAFEDEHRQLLTSAFLRFFALGRDADAAALIPDLISLWPDRADALRNAWARRGETGYRLAQVALTFQTARTLLAPYWHGWSDRGTFENNLQADWDLEFWVQTRRSRDLPIAIRTGGFLERDFRTWMETVASSPYARESARRRAYRRGQTLPDVLTSVRPILPKRSAYHLASVGPAAFAGWDELARLGPESGLANRIGRELILNARARSSGPLRGLFGDRERLGMEMELVIREARRMISGDFEGRPLGQSAFAILQGPLNGTEAAQRTPYWFICRERCEP